MSNEASKDAVYSEFYEEMRRFRDFELNVSTWYTNILLAILAGIIALKVGAGICPNTNPAVEFVIIIVVILLGYSSYYSIKYANRRYRQLRKYVDENLEPDWKDFEPEKIKIVPRHFILLTQVLLLISIIVFLVI